MAMRGNAATISSFARDENMKAAMGTLVGVYVVPNCATGYYRVRL